jgi:predicted translin family RNA/ssDNA-binding protein
MSEQASIDQLIEATLQAREVIREAHEALKDLRRERTEARAEVERLKAAVQGVTSGWRAGLMNAALEETVEVTTIILDVLEKRRVHYLAHPEFTISFANYPG